MEESLINGRPTMAHTLGYTVDGLAKMEQRGLPVYKKGSGGNGKGNQYLVSQVLPWVLADQQRQFLKANRSQDTKEVFARRAEAETRKAEIEVGKLEGKLGDLEVIQRGLEGVMINQRTILLGVPAQIGREIDEPEIRVRVVKMVDRRIREALEALSTYDPRTSDEHRGETRDHDDSEDGDFAQAAPPVDREPVGRAKTVLEPRRRRQRAVAK